MLKEATTKTIETVDEVVTEALGMTVNLETILNMNEDDLRVIKMYKKLYESSTELIKQYAEVIDELSTKVDIMYDKIDYLANREAKREMNLEEE